MAGLTELFSAAEGAGAGASAAGGAAGAAGGAAGAAGGAAGAGGAAAGAGSSIVAGDAAGATVKNLAGQFLRDRIMGATGLDFGQGGAARNALAQGNVADIGKQFLEARIDREFRRKLGVSLEDVLKSIQRKPQQQQQSQQERPDAPQIYTQ